MNHFLMIGPWQVLLLFIAVAFFILPTVIALVDIVRNEFSGHNKIVWLLLVLLGNLLGAILYFTIGRQQRLTKST